MIDKLNPISIIRKISSGNLLSNEQYKNLHKINRKCYWTYDLDFNNYINPYSTAPPPGYFKVELQSYFHDYAQNLFSGIEHNYQNKKNKYQIKIIFVAVNQIEKFINEFRNVKEINWTTVFSETNIPWTYELILKYKDFWDWNKLCCNQGFRWDEGLIDIFQNYVDFKSISQNKNVEWTESLIDKYYPKWDWKILSENPNLPWSFDFIKKHEDKWQYNSNNLSHLENCVNVYPSQYPCLSINSGIFWDEKLIQEYYHKIDLWHICRKGKISNHAIMKYNADFRRKEYVNTINYKFSDWREKFNKYSSGWENFALNSNFFINNEIVDFLYNEEIRVKYPVGNLADDGYTEEKDFRILDILKNCPMKGITLMDLLDNENGWAQILINDEFINKSIWFEIVKPIFTQFILRYGYDYFFRSDG